MDGHIEYIVYCVFLDSAKMDCHADHTVSRLGIDGYTDGFAYCLFPELDEY